MSGAAHAHVEETEFSPMFIVSVELSDPYKSVLPDPYKSVLPDDCPIYQRHPHHLDRACASS